MKIVQLPKGNGKTTELLVWLLEGHAKNIQRALIVKDNPTANQIQRRLIEYYNTNGRPKYINNAANRVYTVSAAIRLGPAHFRNCEVGIDDADEILSWLLFKSHRPFSIWSVTDPTTTTEDAGEILAF